MALSVFHNRIQRFVASRPILHRLISGLSWSLVGSISVYAAKLLLSIVAARLLGQIAYGEFGIITSTILLFATFAGFGLGMTATKYLAEHRDNTLLLGRIVGLIYAISFAFGLILSLLIYFSSEFVSINALNAQHLSGELRIGAYFALFFVVYNAQVGILAGFEDFRTLAIVNIVEGMSLLVGTSVGAYLYGVTGAIWGFGIATCVACAICTFYTLKYCFKNNIAIRYSFGKLESSIFWQFGIPSLIVLVLPQIFTWFTRIILVYQPNGYAELGLLNVGFAWSAVISFFPRQISRPALPMLTDLFYKRNMSAYRRLLNLNIALSLIVTLLLVIPIALLARPIMTMYGNEYIDGWGILVIMVMAFGLGAITVTFRDLIASQGNMWMQVSHTAVWGTVLVSLSYGLRLWGAMGVAIAFLVAYVSLVLVQFIFLRFVLLSSKTENMEERRKNEISVKAI